MTTGFVYAILGDNGLVKVGFSKEPRGRLNKINSDASCACRLLGAIPATEQKFKEGSSSLRRVYTVQLQYFSAFWPGDVEWPSQVERPSETKAVKGLLREYASHLRWEAIRAADRQLKKAEVAA